jgi:hypothetical protein
MKRRGRNVKPQVKTGPACFLSFGINDITVSQVAVFGCRRAVRHLNVNLTFIRGKV